MLWVSECVRVAHVHSPGAILTCLALPRPAPVEVVSFPPRSRALIGVSGGVFRLWKPCKVVPTAGVTTVVRL